MRSNKKDEGYSEVFLFIFIIPFKSNFMFGWKNINMIEHTIEHDGAGRLYQATTGRESDVKKNEVFFNKVIFN
jgi:hypothetical protein